MGKKVDLHTHTVCSDGSQTPSELIEHASKNGLSVISVTDHDTVQGIPECLEAASKTGIVFIPGVEISVDFNPEMHILGYFTETGYKKIEGMLEQLKRNRQERNPKIVAKLNELGMPITLQDVEEEALKSDEKATGAAPSLRRRESLIIGRPHFAAVLVKKGYVSSLKEAFDKYLGDDKPAYFKKDKLSPEEGIRGIIQAGGIPVLAHPIHLGYGRDQLDGLLGRLTAVGLKGIEAYYVDNSRTDTGNLLRIAISHGLIATGGSDYHGIYKPDIELGSGYGELEVPFECYEKLKQALDKNNKIGQIMDE